MPNQTYPASSSTIKLNENLANSVNPYPYVNADLPVTVFNTRDDSLADIYMTLQPEYSITAPEALKIMMMLTAAIYAPQFSVFQYVKKNDLERHFKYSR